MRHRIGTLLSSNHVLDESNAKDLFKKEIGMSQHTQNNPLKLATDSGLAPPTNNYEKPRPSDDALNNFHSQASNTGKTNITMGHFD